MNLLGKLSCLLWGQHNWGVPFKNPLLGEIAICWWKRCTRCGTKELAPRNDSK